MISWLVGPIFQLECVLAARRWQTYAGRTAFLALLLISLISAWIWWVPGNNRNSLAHAGEAFFVAIAGTQLAIALLVTPAYFAASICLDRARGNLTHMLVTDLSAREIILGKLGALGSLLFGLILAGTPVLILATLLGGIDPEAVVGGFFVTLAAAALLSAMTTLLSVWGRRLHEVLLTTYLFEAVWLLAWPTWLLLAPSTGVPPDWVKVTNPFAMVFGPYAWPGGASIEAYALFLGATLGAAAGCTVLACLTLRWAVCREVVRRTWRWSLPRLTLLAPTLDYNPVLWREWRRPTPSLWLRNIWGIYLIASLGASLAALLSETSNREFAPFVSAFQFSIGLLLVNITSVASLFEERVNGSLDMLLTTPLSTASIVWGKWLASFRVVVGIGLLPVLLACGLAIRSQAPERWPLVVILILLVSAYGAMINSLGLALATCISRFGVAMGLAVAINVALSVVPVLLLLGTRNHESGRFSVSPWYGVGETTALINGAGPGNLSHNETWKICYAIAYGCVAMILFIVTRLVFDRCMGRVSDSR